MEKITIEVPNMNDSISRVSLDGKAYLIRFTYNDTHDYWTFGLYTSLNEPIAVGIKIVPGFPLNLFFGGSSFPLGVFGAISKKSRIGRNDFADGNAKFIFCTAPKDEE